jgi:hypothetical protein
MTAAPLPRCDPRHTSPSRTFRTRSPGPKSDALAGPAFAAGEIAFHALRMLFHMADLPPGAAWQMLGAEPGLCGACRHAKLNETRRGTAYLRCLRAAWDKALARYPRLPVTQCEGFEQREERDEKPQGSRSS